MKRDDARALFAGTGLKFADLLPSDLKALKNELDASLRASGLMDGNFRMRPRVQFFDWPTGWAALRCDSRYFENREAVSFNPGGFIGFAGWADDTNVQPVLEGFVNWCKKLPGIIAARTKLPSEPMAENGLYGQCERGHVFLVAKLPMELAKAAELARRASCPTCGATKGIVVAPQPQEAAHG